MDNFQDLYGCCGRREKTGENGGRGNGTETEKNIDHHSRYKTINGKEQVVC